VLFVRCFHCELFQFDFLAFSKFVNKYLFVSAAGELQFTIPAFVYKFAKNLGTLEQF
jgi:hypothetical protein